MKRNEIPVPAHQRSLPNLLSVAGGIGFALFLAGLLLLHVWMAILGGVIAFMAKLWFADRMVWLYEEMKDATPEYKSWLY